MSGNGPKYRTKDHGVNDAELCRRNGWGVGTRLVGDEGYGPTVIEITGLGETHLLAKTISHNGKEDEEQAEGSWTLSCRDWSKVETPRRMRGRTVK